MSHRSPILTHERCPPRSHPTPAPARGPVAEAGHQTRRLPRRRPPARDPRQAYGTGSPRQSPRALQRDLEDLVQDKRIEIVNPGGKPLRYRRINDTLDDDARIWDFTLRQVRDIIAEAVPKRQLDRLWERLLYERDRPLLSDQQLRVVPDSLRLRPVELYPDVLHAVISALAQRCALQVVYKNAADERSTPILHPQALVQRGPIPYLFALKNDEDHAALLCAAPLHPC